MNPVFQTPHRERASVSSFSPSHIALWFCSGGSFFRLVVQPSDPRTLSTLMVKIPFSLMSCLVIFLSLVPLFAVAHPVVTSLKRVVKKKIKRWFFWVHVYLKMLLFLVDRILHLVKLSWNTLYLKYERMNPLVMKGVMLLRLFLFEAWFLFFFSLCTWTRSWEPLQGSVVENHSVLVSIPTFNLLRL